MQLHDGAVTITLELARSLLRDAGQAHWASRTMTPAGHGTDNVMYRLGDDLVMRLPQRPDSGDAIRKEAEWLSRLVGALPVAVPEPVFVAEGTEPFLAPWAVYRWLDGVEPTVGSVDDWPRFGNDLAGFVSALHRVDVAGDLRAGEAPASLQWYRGQPLADFAEEAVRVIEEEIAPLLHRKGLDLDLGRLASVWERLAATPQVLGDPVLLHGDLRAANLLVDRGHLTAVIDFGTLSIGQPAAEHGPIWNFPRPARDAYRAALGLSDDDWALSLGWTLLPALTGLPYYWDSWPEFARECLARIELVMEEAG